MVWYGMVWYGMVHNVWYLTYRGTFGMFGLSSTFLKLG